MEWMLTCSSRVQRFENERSRVDTVSLPGRFGSIVENVAKMSPAFGAENFIPDQMGFALDQLLIIFS